jgi:hypothetical protein
MFFRRMLSALLLFALVATKTGLSAESRPFALRTNDVVAFIGGSDVAAAQFTGHLETLLAIKFLGARFRNFGWEGDTVFAQPRDVGFSPLPEHFKRAGVTVLFLEFGRAEALDGKDGVTNFFAAYEKLVTQCMRQSPRIVLVTPPPFEKADEPLPDLSKRNRELAFRANAVRTLAQRHSFPVVDLFSEFGGVNHIGPRLTDNGLQLTPRGHALIAAAFARQLGFAELAAKAGDVKPDGAWANAPFENLRRSVIKKNKLWFNYWRPQNWAFLGGDRVSQPSSHDHRDPKVRWFPAEMEKYVPLIREKEVEMERIAAELRGAR